MAGDLDTGYLAGLAADQRVRLERHEWATLAGQLRAQLVLPDLDPNPLATIERLVKDEERQWRSPSRNEAGNPGH